jgi:hypothetical protein
VGIQAFHKTDIGAYLKRHLSLIPNNDRIAKVLAQIYNMGPMLQSTNKVRTLVAQSNDARSYLDKDTEEDAVAMMISLEELLGEELHHCNEFQALRKDHKVSVTIRREFYDTTENGECGKCGSLPRTDENEFFFLELNVNPKHSVISLSTMMKNHFSTLMMQMRCSGCCPHDRQNPPIICNGKEVMCKEKLVTQFTTMSKAPKYMFVRLLRGDHNGKKFTNLIQLEDVLKMPGGEEYMPIVIISHIGKSLHSGHYIAFVKSESDNWWKCNDTMTTLSSLLDANTKDNYSIVFKKLCYSYLSFSKLDEAPIEKLISKNQSSEGKKASISKEIEQLETASTTNLNEECKLCQESKIYICQICTKPVCNSCTEPAKENGTNIKRKHKEDDKWCQVIVNASVFPFKKKKMKPPK